MKDWRECLRKSADTKMTELKSLQQAFDEMKTLAAQRLEALKEAERQRDELALKLTSIINYDEGDIDWRSENEV